MHVYKHVCVHIYIYIYIYRIECSHKHAYIHVCVCMDPPCSDDGHNDKQSNNIIVPGIGTINARVYDIHPYTYTHKYTYTQVCMDPPCSYDGLDDKTLEQQQHLCLHKFVIKQTLCV